jgi:hypothetical protein
MGWVGIFASGLFSFFNRVIVTGLLGKAIFLVILSWVIATLLSGIVGLLANFLNLTPVGSVLGPLGDAGAIGLWFFGMVVAPYAVLSIAGRVIRFIIRRLPVVG